MKFSSLIKLTVIANIFAANFIAMPSTKASTFEEKEMAQEQIIALAAPYRHGYNLVVIEQVPGKDQCWLEQGIAPVAVDALLMNFDFTDHCNRATDSNGYSVRINGEERGTDFLLQVVERDHELLLVATQRDPNQTPLVIGRTNGKSDGITKIMLNPGWDLTKRSYRGKELSHFYFSQGGSPRANINPESKVANAATTNTIESQLDQVNITTAAIETQKDAEVLF